MEGGRILVKGLVRGVLLVPLSTGAFCATAFWVPAVIPHITFALLALIAACPRVVDRRRMVFARISPVAISFRVGDLRYNILPAHRITVVGRAGQRFWVFQVMLCAFCGVAKEVPSFKTKIWLPAYPIETRIRGQWRFCSATGSHERNAKKN